MRGFTDIEEDRHGTPLSDRGRGIKEAFLEEVTPQVLEGIKRKKEQQ